MDRDRSGGLYEYDGAIGEVTDTRAAELPALVPVGTTNTCPHDAGSLKSLWQDCPWLVSWLIAFRQASAAILSSRACGGTLVMLVRTDCFAIGRREGVAASSFLPQARAIEDSKRASNATIMRSERTATIGRYYRTIGPRQFATAPPSRSRARPAARASRTAPGGRAPEPERQGQFVYLRRIDVCVSGRIPCCNGRVDYDLSERHGGRMGKRTIGLLLLGAVAGCGSSGLSHAGTGGSSGTGGSNGTGDGGDASGMLTFTTTFPPAMPLGQITFAELPTICRDIDNYRGELASDATFRPVLCKYAGIQAGISTVGPNATDAQVQQACITASSNCQSNPPRPFSILDVASLLPTPAPPPWRSMPLASRTAWFRQRPPSRAFRPATRSRLPA